MVPHTCLEIILQLLTVDPFSIQGFIRDTYYFHSIELESQYPLGLWNLCSSMGHPILKMFWVSLGGINNYGNFLVHCCFGEVIHCIYVMGKCIVYMFQNMGSMIIYHVLSLKCVDLGFREVDNPTYSSHVYPRTL